MKLPQTRSAQCAARRWSRGWAIGLVLTVAALGSACQQSVSPPPAAPARSDDTLLLWITYVECRDARKLETRKGAAIVLLEAAQSLSPVHILQWRRRSVNLHAMAASCGLMVGAAMEESGQARQAELLYRRILDQPLEPELIRYKTAAQHALHDITRHEIPPSSSVP